MLSKTLLILGLAAIGSSFTLREGLPDGFYRAYYNDAGEEVHELVSASALNTTSSLLALPKREDSRSERHTIATRSETPLGYWCGCDNPMNAYDTNMANAGMDNLVASYPLIQPGEGFFIIHNTAAAFVCNVDDKSSNIPTDVVTTWSQTVTNYCGLFYAGTVRIQWTAALDYGYMNYEPGLDFCDQAESSQDAICCNPGSWYYADYENCISICEVARVQLKAALKFAKLIT